MPELTLALFLLIGGSLAVGFLLGWLLRAVHANQQKVAINAEWHEQIEALRQSEQRVNRQRKELSAELAGVRTDFAALQERMSATTESTATTDQLRGQVEELQEALESSNERRTRLRRDLNRFIEKSREFTAASRQKDEKIFALSRELESWQTRLPPLVDKFREQQEENTCVLEELEVQRQLNAELSESLRTRMMPVGSPPTTNGAGERAPGAEHGGLQRIRGVGPALEKTLNDLGIYRLEQIAELSSDEAEQLAAKLPQFPERIRRDRWIEQARELTGR